MANSIFWHYQNAFSVFKNNLSQLLEYCFFILLPLYAIVYGLSYLEYDLLSTIAVLLLFPISMIIGFKLMYGLVDGHEVTLRQAISAVHLKSFISLFAAFIVVMGVFIVYLLPVIILIWLPLKLTILGVIDFRYDELGSIITMFLIVVGMFIAIICEFIALSRTVFSGIIVVTHEQGALSAISNNISLAKGHTWRISKFFILTCSLFLVLGILLSTVVPMLGFLRASLGVGTDILISLISIVIFTIFSLFLALAMMSFFTELSMDINFNARPGPIVYIGAVLGMIIWVSSIVGPFVVPGILVPSANLDLLTFDYLIFQVQ